MTLTTDRLRELRAIDTTRVTACIGWEAWRDIRAVIDESIAAREAAVATDVEVEAAIDAFHHANRKRDVEAARAKLRSLFRQQPAPEPPDPWTPTVRDDYDRAIHNNPHADAWADFFVSTFPGLREHRETMLGWFANAMMAMHDSIKAQQPAPDLLAAAEAVVEGTYVADTYGYRNVLIASIEALRAAVESARKP
jgi:hypothetical protein